MKIKDFGKNIKELFNKLINEGEVEDVGLTGILADDPEFLKKFQSLDEAGKNQKTAKTNTKAVSPEQYVEDLKARPAKPKNTTPKTQPKVNRQEKDDELSL